MRLPLSDEQIQTLQNRTDGWVAALDNRRHRLFDHGLAVGGFPKHLLLAVTSLIVIMMLYEFAVKRVNVCAICLG